jgi:hypothetical protein
VSAFNLRLGGGDLRPALSEKTALTGIHKKRFFYQAAVAKQAAG